MALFYPSATGSAAAAAAGGANSSAAIRLKNTQRQNRLLRGDTPHVEYDGTNHGAHAYHQAFYHSYAVGVVTSNPNPASADTVSIQLVDVPHVYVMRQTVKGVAAEEMAKRDDIKAQAEAANAGKDEKTRARDEHAIKRKSLVETFGSRKKLRAFKSEEAGAVKLTGASASLQALNKALTDVKQPVLETESSDDESGSAAGGGGGAVATGALSTILPPYDDKTTDPAKIYDIKHCMKTDSFALHCTALHRQFRSLTGLML